MASFRKAALSASMAAGIAIVSNATWMAMHADAAGKRQAVEQSPELSCDCNFTRKVARMMSNPKKQSEFIDLISEATLTYRRTFFDVRGKTDDYLKRTRRSWYAEKKLLKRAREVETSYRDAVRHAITSYAVESPESRDELFSLLRGCLYVDGRSISRLVRERLIAKIVNHEWDESPAEWVADRPPLTPKRDTVQSRNEDLVRETMESLNRREQQPLSTTDSFTLFTSSDAWSLGGALDKRKER